MTTCVLETARGYLSAGLSVIPNGSGGGPPRRLVNVADQTAVEFLTEQLKLFLPVFAPRGERFVTELRALQVPGWKGSRPTDDCGFFDLGDATGREAFFRAVKSYVERPAEMQPEGLYCTINPVDPVYLARANNAMGKKGQKISADAAHVERRKWLVVDADPKRPISKISATDLEKAEARKVIEAVRADLMARGFARPMLCDSGNGFHLWYRVDLPADDGGAVERTLKLLARRHDTARAAIDTGIFDAPRIMKIPGTVARKGASTADRPHRPARVLEVPS